MEYTTLSAHDRLALARDTLRARESDHYRFSLTPEAAGGEARLKTLADQIETLRDEVKKLEKEVASEDQSAPTPRSRQKTTKNENNDGPGSPGSKKR